MSDIFDHEFDAVDEILNNWGNSNRQPNHKNTKDKNKRERENSFERFVRKTKEAEEIWD